MIKILHMTPPEVQNGVCQYIFNHMPFLDQSRYEFSFLTKASKELAETKEYARYHFPIYRLDGVQREGQAGFEREIRGILDRGFDVIHLHTSAWRGFLIEEIAMEMKIPKVIVHSHSSGIDFVSENEREQIWKEHTYYKEKFTMDYATDVCACSELAADWLFSDNIPRSRIQILPNAVDVRKFHFVPEVRERLRRKLGIEDRVVIGNVGRYSYTKNQEFLVRCFAEAYKRNPKLYLILIGQGENISYIRKLVNELDMKEHIRCYGWMENIHEFLQAMDLFCLPSRFEGLPISAVEAQASGLKCLISDAVTRETDLTGLVRFIPLEKDCWIDAMGEAGEDADRDIMDQAFEKAGYSMEASCGRLMRLYESG